MLNAIQYLSDQHLVHGDVSSSTVLLTMSGTFKLSMDCQTKVCTPCKTRIRVYIQHPPIPVNTGWPRSLLLHRNGSGGDSNLEPSQDYPFLDFTLDRNPPVLNPFQDRRLPSHVPLH